MRTPSEHNASSALLQQFFEAATDAAVERPGHMRVTVKNVTQIEHAEFRSYRGPDGRARQHDVDRADLDLLHHIGFLAELAVWEKIRGNTRTCAGPQVSGEALVPDVMRGVLVRGQ